MSPLGTSSFSFKAKPPRSVRSRTAQRPPCARRQRAQGRQSGAGHGAVVDASNGYQLWSERYDREIADIFDVQDEIARAIVERLKVVLAGGSSARLVKVTTRTSRPTSTI